MIVFILLILFSMTLIDPKIFLGAILCLVVVCAVTGLLMAFGPQVEWITVTTQTPVLVWK